MLLDFRVWVAAALPALLAGRLDAADDAAGDTVDGEGGDPEESDAQGDAEDGVCPVVGGFVAHGALSCDEMSRPRSLVVGGGQTCVEVLR